MISGGAAKSDSEPRKILKLDEDVVNRIAAGEVQISPTSRVKYHVICVVVVRRLWCPQDRLALSS